MHFSGCGVVVSSGVGKDDVCGIALFPLRCHGEVQRISDGDMYGVVGKDRLCTVLVVCCLLQVGGSTGGAEQREEGYGDKIFHKNLCMSIIWCTFAGEIVAMFHPLLLPDLLYFGKSGTEKEGAGYLFTKRTYCLFSGS